MVLCDWSMRAEGYIADYPWQLGRTFIAIEHIKKVPRVGDQVHMGVEAKRDEWLSHWAEYKRSQQPHTHRFELTYPPVFGSLSAVVDAVWWQHTSAAGTGGNPWVPVESGQRLWSVNVRLEALGDLDFNEWFYVDGYQAWRGWFVADDSEPDRLVPPLPDLTP